MKIEELAKIIKESNYEFIGIRHLADDEEYKVGDYCRNSYDWDCENDISSYNTENPIELNGSCAYNTEIDTFYDEIDEIIEKLEKSIKISKVYVGKMVIIGSDCSEYGCDDNEIILKDAKVLYVQIEE